MRVGADGWLECGCRAMSTPVSATWVAPNTDTQKKATGAALGITVQKSATFTFAESVYDRSLGPNPVSSRCLIAPRKRAASAPSTLRWS